ncbi:anti-sigma factor family protein [Roseobacter sp.]|uniref:anti-sigma factor family protein n=1 Tax=Roseobacter sp. TaxID=1907202 RepID=UPI00385A74AF
MTDLSVTLSAYLDGELAPSDVSDIETRLDSDPALQAQLDALIQAHVAAEEQFDAQLSQPIPLSLVKQIKDTPLPDMQAPVRPVWGALAASLVALLIGGAGGYFYKDQLVQQQPAEWLAAVADYHGVYASQGRHLVEVGAEEAEHIETWLGNTVGATFSIPDLKEFGLTFEGGRLLVANGKPVAQLMYRQEDGTVIALCLQRSAASHDGPPQFKETSLNGFDFVSWRTDSTDFVVIGPNGQPNLNAVAMRAALDI